MAEVDKPVQESVQQSRSLLLGVALFCVSLALYAFLQSAYFALDEIVIEGNQYLREHEVVALAGLEIGQTIFDIDLRATEERLKSDPRIASARVVRRLPSTIDVLLVERVPVAYLASAGVYVAFDREGRPLTIGEEARLPLPQLHGVEETAVELGEQAEGADLLGALLIADRLRPDLVGRVKEIGVLNGRYELVFYDDLVVRLGDLAEMNEKLERLRDILQVLERPVAEIDLRVPRNPVLR